MVGPSLRPHAAVRARRAARLSGRAVVVLLLLGSAWWAPGAIAQQGDDHEWTVEHRSPEYEVGQGGRIELAGVCKLSGRPMEVAAAHLSRNVAPGDAPLDVRATFPVGADGRWSGAVEVQREAPAGRYHLVVSCRGQDRVGDAEDFPYEVVAEPGAPTSTAPTTVIAAEERGDPPQDPDVTRAFWLAVAALVAGLRITIREAVSSRRWWRSSR